MIVMTVWIRSAAPTALQKNSLIVSCFVFFPRTMSRQGEKSDSFYRVRSLPRSLWRDNCCGDS